MSCKQELLSELCILLVHHLNYLGLCFLLYAHHQVVYYTCVKFHQYQFIYLGEVGLTRWTDRWTNKVIPMYPQYFVFGEYNGKLYTCIALPTL